MIKCRQNLFSEGYIIKKILPWLGVSNFKNVRALTLAAVLIALAVIGYGLLRIPIIPGQVEMRFGFLFIAATAFLFGPAVAFPAGVIASMLGFLLFSTGAAFNPLFDLNEGFAGILFAAFLYKRNPKSEYFIIWIVLARASVNIICNIIIRTHLLVLFGFIPPAGINVVTTLRIFRNIMLLPVEIIMMFIIIKFVAVYAQRYNFIKPQKIIKKENNI